jgi:predicted nucleic acid-binding protein
MNVIIDTNIFISAILSQRGSAIEVLKLALLKNIKPQIGLKGDFK